MDDEYWDDDAASQSTNPSQAQAIEEEPEYCPLCMEMMDPTDLAFQPCECGYQICLYCYQSIIEKLNAQCPACRRIYDTDRAISQAMLTADPNTIKQSTRQTSSQSQATKPKKSNQSTYQTALQNVRIIQRNLVYIQNLPQNLAHEEILRKHQYFGKYGKILKASVARRMVSSSTSTSTSSSSNPPLQAQYSGYVTYKNNAHAEAAIKAMNGIYLNAQSSSNSQSASPPLKVTYGTTKYCAFFIRSLPCTNAQCLYLHEIARNEDCVHKDDLIDDPMIDPSLKDKPRDQENISREPISQSHPVSQSASQPFHPSATPTKISASQYDSHSFSTSTSLNQSTTAPLPSPPVRQSSSNSDHPVSIFSFPLPSESKADGWAAIAAGQATPSVAQTSTSTKDHSPPLTPSAIQWPALPSSNRNNQSNNQSNSQTTTGPLVLRKASFPTSSTIPSTVSTSSIETPPHSPQQHTASTSTSQSPAALSTQSVSTLLNPRVETPSGRAPPGFAARPQPSSQPAAIASSSSSLSISTSQSSPAVPPPVRTSDPALEAVFAPAKSLTQSANLHDDTVLGMFGFYNSPLHARQPSLVHSLAQPHPQPHTSSRHPPPGFGPIAQPSAHSRLSSFNPPPGFGPSLSRQSSSSSTLNQSSFQQSAQSGNAATWDFDAFVEQLRLSTSENSFPSMPTGNEPLQPINQLNSQSLNHSSVASPNARYGQHGVIGSAPGNSHAHQNSSPSWMLHRSSQPLFSRPINQSNKHPSVSDLNDDAVDDWSEHADRESFLSLSPKPSQSSGNQFDSSASSFLSPGLLRSSSAFDYTDSSPLAQWQQIQASLYPAQSQSTGNDIYRGLSGAPSIGSNNLSSVAPGAQLASPSRGILSLKALPTSSTNTQSSPSSLNRVVGPSGYPSLNTNLYNPTSNNNGVQAAR